MVDWKKTRHIRKDRKKKKRDAGLNISQE